MKKSVLIALLAVAVTAMPALASVQNVKVSGDIDTTWLVRDQFDLGHQTQTNQFYQNLMITQTRLRVDADLTDNVSATVALINERAWDESLQDADGYGSTDPAGANDVDLNLAYVTLREMLYSPLTVMIGRQAFAYGNSFIIDSNGANNVDSSAGLNNVAEDLTKGTALDAVRLVFDYNPLTLDFVAAKVDANNLDGLAPHDDDVDLFGTNANYKLGDDWETVVEGYFWAKIDQSVKHASVSSGNVKADSVYLPGFRASTNPIKGLNVQAELAWQFGNKALTDSSTTPPDNVDRHAMAAQAIANYMLPFESTAQWQPLVTGVYTYVSGDSNPAEPRGSDNDGYDAWDPMFENQAGGTVYNTLFDLTNAHIFLVESQIKPMEDVTAKLGWTGIWIDKDITGLDGITSTAFAMRQPNGSTITPTVTSNKKVGDEIDMKLTYDYTEDVQFGLNMGWFLPGNFFHENNDDIASQVLLNGIVNF